MDLVNRSFFGVLCLLLVAASGLGCASMQPVVESQGIFEEAPGAKSGLRVETVPEGERVMLIKSPDDTERVCSPRESDEGLGITQGFQLSMPLADGSSAGIEEDSGDAAVALGSPTTLVELSRELLFRACELSLNLDASPDQTLAIYERFLTSLETLAPYTQDGNGDDGDDDDDDDDGDDDDDDDDDDGVDSEGE